MRPQAGTGDRFYAGPLFVGRGSHAQKGVVRVVEANLRVGDRVQVRFPECPGAEGMAVAAVVTGVEGGRVLLRPVRRRWPDLRTGDSAVLELVREGESFQWFGTIADPDGLVVNLSEQTMQRRHKRWRVGDAGRVAWRRAGDLGEPGRARMLDVSESGLGFFTVNPPQPGELVELNAEVPGAPRLTVTGRVVRVVPWAGGVCLVGVEFTRVDGAELEAFLRCIRVQAKALVRR